MSLWKRKDMCQSSLVDEKAENITKGLSDIHKKKSRRPKKKSKTFPSGEADMNIVTVPSGHDFPILHTTVRLTQLDHGQQPSLAPPRLTLANRIPFRHASTI